MEISQMTMKEKADADFLSINPEATKEMVDEIWNKRTPFRVKEDMLSKDLILHENQQIKLSQMT